MLACPRVKTPFQVTLADAIYFFEKTEAAMPSASKKAKLSHCSLEGFFTVVHDPPPSQDDMEAAQKRREEYVGDVTFCDLCNCEKVVHASEAAYTCPTCGDSIDGQGPDTSFRNGVSITSCYLYLRRNHFRDHLSRAQGKESTQFSDDILEAIGAELRKSFYTPEGGDDFERVKPEDVRAILKKLGMSRFYNHNVRIWSLVTGNQPLLMTQQQETELCALFDLIQEPWQRHKPSERKNMLSYSYVLRKMCAVLGYDELARSFRYLKSTEKIRAQDDLWRKICEDLNLPFVRSVR